MTRAHWLRRLLAVATAPGSGFGGAGRRCHVGHARQRLLGRSGPLAGRGAADRRRRRHGRARRRGRRRAAAAGSAVLPLSRYTVASLLAKSPFEHAGGSLLVRGDATFEDTFNWSGGVIHVDSSIASGTWTFRKGLHLTAPGLVGMNAGAVELQGTSIIEGGVGILFGAVPVHIASGATLDIRSGDRFVVQSSLINDGNHRPHRRHRHIRNLHARRRQSGRGAQTAPACCPSSTDSIRSRTQAASRSMLARKCGSRARTASTT
jgi:hypothetical protein